MPVSMSCMENAAHLPRRLLSIGSDAELDTNTKALYACVAALLVCGSGLASGLTLGLMSLDRMEMQVLLRSGTPKQQRLARTIMPIIADPHWLLVTLLLCNAGCFEALPLFLDSLISPVGAILISVTLVLVFGEILPQAVCARHGLAIGAALGWPVRFFMWLTSPISWPLARLLDCVLGREGYNTFMRHELKALVDLHGADEGLGGKLSDNEVQIICGALDLTNKIAYSAMTPLDKVIMLSDEQRLDRATIATILASGHSRLPVYAGDNKSNIIGLLLVKELLAHAFPTPEELKEGSVRVSTLKIRPLPRLPGSTRCYDMLTLFQTGRAHMVLLTQPAKNEERNEQATEDADALEVERSACATSRAKAEQIDLSTMNHRKSLHEPSITSPHSPSTRHLEPVAEVPEIASPGEPIGIITIEDVLEELMGQEILDETDYYADNECTLPVNEETRIKLAQKLPAHVREVVVGSGIIGIARRLSRASIAGLSASGSTTRMPRACAREPGVLGGKEPSGKFQPRASLPNTELPDILCGS